MRRRLQHRSRRYGIALAVAVLLLASATSFADLPQLTVSENQRFLVTEDGQPFFWLGDTAWELFHRLNREEADRYLQNRVQNGYTVIQAVALAEINGHSDPNPYGHLPFIDLDPTRPSVKDGPENDYWDHVDYIVNKANELGLYIGFLPTWGRYWHDNVNDNKPLFTVENAESYGQWLGQRYKTKRLIWILGGDRTIENTQQKEIIRAMARGLRKGDGGAHLMTFHPRGGHGSAEDFHNDEWLDFNMRQNGHNVKFNEGFQNTRVDYDRTPVKPILDGEPIYEDHPVSFRANDLGHSIASDVRRPLYWNLFSGAFGHTYGHHSVWQMWQPGRNPINNPLMPWYEAIHQPGAAQMQYGRWLIQSRPFLSRIPDDTILVPHRPDGRPVESQRNTIVEMQRTHVVYTRNEAGNTALYINGKVVETSQAGGNVENWNGDFHLALANELIGDRPWLGDLYRVALYARALPQDEIARLAQSMKNTVPDPIVLYDFSEGSGAMIHDKARSGEALPLRIKDPASVQWLADGGLRVTKPAQIASSAPAVKITEAVQRSNALTIEAWIKPANLTQAGPARIVTVSLNMGERNFTLGQKAGAYEVRFRTSATSSNGEPALSTPGSDDALTIPSAVPGAGRYRFTATRDREGTYAMIYAPVSRPFSVWMDTITGPKVNAWWYNPRNGQATAIDTYDNKGAREFTPPDLGEMTDWVLVLDDASKRYPVPGGRD